MAGCLQSRTVPGTLLLYLLPTGHAMPLAARKRRGMRVHRVCGALAMS